ncbi:hypothetical protein LTR24_009763 [Lithohypha guttulata]|uniref:ATPase inhibitor, mitochondrial n=1 Tax=Lithohypha guttulata TaxID=1690604 RepID=A0ABR0JW53_9EURO|nr:hypothetical protein LTR24_009763 [Lithohypha guttulata]
MLRTQIVKLTRAPIRSFSVAAIRPAEGDTGGVRSGGSATSREAASENKFIREREMETLRQLKEKLKAQRKHLDDLDAHITDLESQKGGEQN